VAIVEESGALPLTRAKEMVCDEGGTGVHGSQSQSGHLRTNNDMCKSILDDAPYAVSKLPYIHIRTATMAPRVHDNSTMLSSQRQRLASILCMKVTSLRESSFW
jgi:hypothetical protein